MNLSVSSSEPGDPGGKSCGREGLGLGGRSSEGEGGTKGSKVVTVPQVRPPCRLLGSHRGTQGSWKVVGEEVGVRWGVLSRRGGVEQEEEEVDLLRPGRRLRESERSGGGGGRLDLRREMLRVRVLGWGEEEVLDFLLSRLREEGEEVVVLSEHREVLSVNAGEERPEERRGSQLQSPPV